MTGPDFASTAETEGAPCACLFPRLVREGPPGKKNRHTIQFDSITDNLLQKCCDKVQVAPHLVLAAVWAAVLRQFTEVDQPGFLVSLKNKDALNNYTTETYRAKIQPGEEVKEFMRAKNWDRHSPVEGYRLYNTALFVVEDEEVQPTAVVAGAKLTDIIIVLQLGKQAPALSLAFSTQVLSPVYAEMVISAISQGIRHVLDVPSVPLKDLELFSTAQAETVKSWQSSPPLHIHHDFMFEVIAGQATQQPDSVAVDAWDSQWTYQELDIASSHLAVQLKARRVGSGIHVPVCFEKSGYAILAMLAVNKAGGSFVPCDPSYPAERQKHIIRSVHAPLILTSPKHADLFSAETGLEVLVVPISTTALLMPAPPSKAHMSPNSPAYVLYTSGSTGSPKGCEISHAAFASITTHTKALHLTPNSRSLQFASFSFGMAIIEIFCTLAAGGTVCMPSADQRSNSLAPTMADMKINWAFMTPTVLGSMQPHDVPYLRDLFIAGEGMNESQVQTWGSSVNVRQAYGLTEWTGVFAVSRRIRDSDQQHTIGVPVDGTAWLVDPNNYHRLVPVGAPGELVISGPALAVGYFEDPQRTKASFFSSSVGLHACPDLDYTIYKTGDIMRYNADGSLAYIRRKDSQVKIRGLRVELGEVEGSLLPLIPNAKRVIAAVWKPQGDGYQQVLVALVLMPVSDATPLVLGGNASELQFLDMTPGRKRVLRDALGKLRDHLPDYMIPQQLLPLTALPTTYTGKVDRRKLGDLLNKVTPEQFLKLAGLQTEYRPPSNEREQLVHDITCSALGLTSVSMQDNFFDLSGDSVAAMKMVGLAYRRKVTLTVADVFEFPVLKHMAARIGQMEKKDKRDVKPFELLKDATPSDIIREVVEQTHHDLAQVVDAYPCTPLQEGLCALSVKDPRAYKARVICKVHPSVEIGAIRDAWERTFQLNDILRTRLVASSSNGTIQAVIQEEFMWDYAENLDDYTAVVNEESMGIGCRLVRACILADSQTTTDPKTLILTIHHSLCDRWSVQLLLEQMEAQLARNPVLEHHEFRPFIEHLGADPTPRYEEYWTSQFHGLEAPIFPELPSPDYKPVVDEVITTQVALPERKLRDKTVASHMRLAWALVIAHNTCSDDVFFGATVSGRGAQMSGIEKVSGPTIATIPLRITLKRSDTVAQSLSTIQDQAIQTMPFEQAGLQNIQKYNPEAEYACKFQSHLTVQPALSDSLTLLTVSEAGPATAGGFASYALCLECYLDADEKELKVMVAFDSNVTSPQRVRRLVNHLQFILSNVLKNPDQMLSEISHVSPSDMIELRQWNEILPSKPQDPIHSVIKKRGYEAPDTLAICAHDGELTYQQLEERATQLAGELWRRGGRPGMLIPLFFEKSVWAIVSMLAVMKIGAGIVALDPSYPLERSRAICEQIGSSVALCSKLFVATVHKIGSKPIVVSESSQIWRQPAEDGHFPSVRPNDTLYLIFTSGSTGTPKGVIVEHGCFASSSRALSPEIKLRKDSRMLQFCSFAFDCCFVEIFSTLMAGACVCIPSELDRTNNIHSAITQLQVSHAVLTPSYARVLQREPIPSLKVLMLAGEPVLSSDAEYWSSRVYLVNGYGPSECAPISATQHNDGRSGIQAQDIGRPAGCVAWVCDSRDHETLLPVGATGELVLEGPNVGPGYFKNPSETESAFVRPPRWLQTLRKGSCERIYKTKDLVRYTDDGRLQYVGRIGNQVKLRGQRLDPSHIENNLRQHFNGAIEVAAIVATPANAGSSSRAVLVGFILTDEGREPCNDDDLCAPANESFSRRASDARTRLQETLPEFMVPSVIIPLVSMPQTPSGKLDRLRLTREVTRRTWNQLMQYDAGGGGPLEAASTAAERELQEIWARVLNLPAGAIGVNQSFLSYGGDSITAMLVVAQARSSQLGLNITVDGIFKLRTISQIAAHAMTTGEITSRLLVSREDVFDVPFPLSPIQQLFFAKNPQGNNRFSHNLLLNLAQPITHDLLRTAAQSLAEHHPMLRARFSQEVGGKWQQIIPKDIEGSFACNVHRLSSRSMIPLVLVQIREGLDIVTGPIFSMDLIEVDGRQSIFALAHHLVMDMVSWPVVLGDIEESLRGGPVHSRPSTSYQTWCHHLADYGCEKLSSPANEPGDDELQRFWGVSDNVNTIGLSSERVLNIDASTTDAVLGKANQAFGTQPVELLHAAILYAFITAFPSRKPPVICSEGHGREPGDAAVDLTGTVGWFTTIAPVHVHLNDAGSDLSMVVRRVKDARRQSPRNGLEAFTANYYNTDNTQIDPSHTMEITFNYGGRYQQQLKQASGLFSIESLQNVGIFDASDSVARWSFVDINTFVHDGMLNFAFTFPTGCSQSQVLEPWMGGIEKALKSMATEFGQYPRSYTLTDFPSLSLGYDQLDVLRSSLSKAGIPAENVEDIYPCAPVQRGILLSQARNPNLYHIAMTWDVAPGDDSAPSVECATSAIEQVIARYACLRTYFIDTASEDSIYDQVVVREATPDIKVRFSEKDGKQSLEVDEDFRPSKECPYRFTLFVSRDKKLYIRLDITHALVDAHTLGMLERDLCLAYDGNLGVGKASLYSNYISYLQAQDRAADQEFWQQYLAACQPCQFPALTDHRSEDPDFNHSLEFKISDVNDALTYCKSNNVTIANVFSLAWALILRAYVGETDVCFGFLSSGRDLPFDGADDVGGPLINILTTRLALGDVPLCELLQRVHSDLMACRPHQSYPIGDIIHDQGTSNSVQINTALSVQRKLPYEKAFTSTGASMILVERQDPSEYGIAMNIEIERDQIVCHLRHWLSCLSDKQASLVASAFDQAVSQIVTNDQATASQVNLLSAQHRNLIWTWNRTVPSPGPESVHEIIHKRATEHPDFLAVCTTDGNLSYRALDTLSDKLTDHLIQMGIGPGSIVPFCFDKGRWTVVAILAVLKAGAAFALMDATQPDERLNSICDDVNSPIILASARQAARCSALGKRVVVVGGDADLWNTYKDQNSKHVARPQPNSMNPMFVVYTSGSTGKPKGVIIENRSFCAMIQAQSPLWCMTPTARLLQFASYAFDASVLEMLLPLMTGATTCILTEVERRDHLAESMVQLRVTHTFMTPSVARLLSPAVVPNLEVLICVGEPMTQLDLNQWANSVRLINSYGPAECTIGAITQPTVTTTSRPGDIGRPAGCVAWIVDLENDQCLVPIGGVGELLIEGPTVGRGYLNNPKATTAAFVPPPQWLRNSMRNGLVDSNTRLYKTGDVVRYDPSGQLCISGRRDTQIKIRGQRIELGEIEYQVHCAFEKAQDVIVELAYSGPDKKTPGLYALISQTSNTSGLGINDPFLVPDETFRSQASSASVSLFEKLPAYMVPSYFLPLATVPVGPSGKADRKKLRALLANLSSEQLKSYRPIDGSKQRAVSSPQEKILQAIWCSVLGAELDSITSDNNFFQIGGDSLYSLARLASAGTTEHFQTVPFSLNPVHDMDVFTLLHRARRNIPMGANIVDILPTSAGQAFFLERPTLHHFTFNIEGSVDVEKLRTACTAVYHKFSILRTLFVKYQDQPLQVILDNVPVPFHHFVTDQEPSKLLELTRDADREQISLHGSLPFAFIFISHRSGRRHSLVCRAIHPQWDGLSLSELFKSIGDAYNGTGLLPQTPLSALVYYRIMRQRSEPSLLFWKKYLQGATISRLTQPPSEPAVALSKGTTIWENTNLQPAPEAPGGITMASVVKAAWGLILAQESGTHDVVFGQTVNGRSGSLPDIDKVLGCCLNFIPVRIRLQETWTVRDLLLHVQNQYQQTVSHDEIELPNIIQNCTDWAAGSDLSSIVQHQNIPLDHALPLGDVKTQFSPNGYFRPSTELFIFTEPVGDILSVQLCVNPNMMDFPRAQALHQRLVRLIVDLCRLPDAPLASLSG
ncbi:hypothetical protein BJX76DRAFT_357678 [Aspergillus varians]